MNGIDLSRFSDKKLNKLFWAAYDMNAAACQLKAAGIIHDGEQFDACEVYERLGKEMSLREAMHDAIEGVDSAGDLA